MIQTYAHQKELHECRLDPKTIETMFINLITDGTNCSLFESEVIVEKAKAVFSIGDHAEGNILQPGQMIWTALDMNEPPGKPLKECKLRRIILTHLKPREDSEVRRLYSRSTKRQQQINRMAIEALGDNRHFCLKKIWRSFSILIIILLPRIIFNNTIRYKKSRQAPLDFYPSPIRATLRALGPIEL